MIMYAIYGNMDPINIPQMLAYIPYMDPMGYHYMVRFCVPFFRAGSEPAGSCTDPALRPGPLKR